MHTSVFLLRRISALCGCENRHEPHKHILMVPNLSSMSPLVLHTARVHARVGMYVSVCMLCICIYWYEKYSMPMRAHACIHACKHKRTYTHAHSRTCIRDQAYTYKHIYNTHTHTTHMHFVRMYMLQSQVHTSIHRLMRCFLSEYTPMYTNVCTCIHTHKTTHNKPHTHTHTHTCMAWYTHTNTPKKHMRSLSMCMRDSQAHVSIRRLISCFLPSKSEGGFSRLSAVPFGILDHRCMYMYVYMCVRA
jgi:hypothetical protein